MFQDVIPSKALGTGGRAVSQPLEKPCFDACSKHLSMETQMAQFGLTGPWPSGSPSGNFPVSRSTSAGIDQKRGHAASFAELFWVAAVSLFALDAIRTSRPPRTGTAREVFAAVFQIETEVRPPPLMQLIRWRTFR